MGSDISRVRFDPQRDFSALVQQQGRLGLDADFNEYVAMLDRRLRALTADVASSGPAPGIAGTSWVPRQTESAFKVGVAGASFTLGRGRMYVDGILAENHGQPPSAWDTVLAENEGSTDLPYEDQPYLPNPAALPAGGPHLVYLDVWQREVTHLQAPDLIEAAVGVDTTSRVQTVWQARLLANVGASACDAQDSAIPGWTELIAPTAGRLTTGTVDLGDDEDPCELPPSGGYRGLENQAYRVEIHDGGPPGTATFKWSRDNGSVAFPVVEMISPTELRLASLGRDDVLRIATNDWVEVLDDYRELTGTPGEIRQVTVDDAERSLTFTTALPAGLQPASPDDAAARHFRVRRWDQSHIVRDATGATLHDLDGAGSTGLITVPSAGGTQVVLEHGVQVGFSVVAGGSGNFKAGDHWIFAARVATASVEQLVEAPPLGTHHHYARLAFIQFGGPEPTDCRTLWPPEGGAGTDGDCCSVTVGDGRTSFGMFNDIQAGVDYVAGQGGGRVCVLRGTFTIDAAVRIESDNIIVSGCGLATLVRSASEEHCFVVRGANGVRIETLAAWSASRQATIRGIASTRFEVRDCLVANTIGLLGVADGPPLPLVAAPLAPAAAFEMPLGAAIAVSEFEGRESQDVSVEDCVLWGLPAVSLQATRVDVNDNRMSGGGVWLSDGSQEIRIERNRIWNGEGPGVLLGGLFLNEGRGSRAEGMAQVAIKANQISSMSGNGITTWGHFREQVSLYDRRRNGLGSLISRLTIDDNEIANCAMSERADAFDLEASGGVILRAVHGLRVADNLIIDNGGERPACAVFIHDCVGADVVGNRVRGNFAPGSLDPETPPSRYQGGLIAPLVTAAYDGVEEVGRARWDEGAAREEAARAMGGGLIDFAIRADDNTIVSPCGQAVLIHAVGPVTLADSMIAAYDVRLQPAMAIGRGEFLTWMGACVRIINFGVGLDSSGQMILGRETPILTRRGVPLDGRVLVHGNQIQFQIPDGSPFFEKFFQQHDRGAAVGLISNDDVSFQDNQVVLYGRPTLG